MESPINISKMVPVEEILDRGQQDAELLKERASEAVQFMRSFRWCRSIRRQLFAGGFSLVAVFLFEIDNTASPEDSYLWVVTGDIPPAYLVVDESPGFKEALLAYAREMRRWVDAAKSGRSVADCIPVNVRPSQENASMLESRLNFIENEYVPSLA